MAIIVLPCTCSHAFQDERHGKGMRVHNPTVKEGRARCTVCKAEHDVRVGGPADAERKKK